MSKPQDKVFTPEEIKQVEELAKTNNINKIAVHFKLSVTSFKYIRKTQPDLESALQRGLSYSNNKDKIFTEEELLEVEELAKTNGMEDVAKHFNMKFHHFSALKRLQPELTKAYQRGIKQRKHGTCTFRIGRKTADTAKLDQASKPIKITEKTLNMSLRDVCPYQALSQYQEMKKVEKERRLYQELREMRDEDL